MVWILGSLALAMVRAPGKNKRLRSRDGVTKSCERERHRPSHLWQNQATLLKLECLAALCRALLHPQLSVLGRSASSGDTGTWSMFALGWSSADGQTDGKMPQSHHKPPLAVARPIQEKEVYFLRSCTLCVVGQVACCTVALYWATFALHCTEI